MPGKKLKPAASRIVQEALPQYESKYRLLAGAQSKYGEARTAWQDGFSGIGWRVAVLSRDGQLLEERVHNDRRDRRTAPSPIRRFGKRPVPIFQSSTFGTLMKNATAELMDRYEIEEDRVEGDFVTGSTKRAEGFNAREILGGTLDIGGYLVLGALSAEISRRNLGHFAIKIDPEAEFAGGRLSFVGVEMALAPKIGSIPAQAFTGYANQILPLYGHLRSLGANHHEASGLATGAVFPSASSELMDRTRL